MDDDTAVAAGAASASSAAAACSGAIAVGSSSSASGPGRFVANLPPGYHFLPTDAELVLHYLRPRLANLQLPLPIFFDERILHYHPDRLIEKYREYGEDRWFFFTKRERKHEGGSRPNRATPDNGHWNATGSPRRIRSGRALVGRVRTLVFYEGPRRKKTATQGEAGPPPVEKDKAHKGVKTEWTMYEYESLASEEEFVATCADGNAKMDVIVLCTIQKKKKNQKNKQGKEKITRTKRKTTEKGQDAEQGSCAGGNKARKKRTRAEEAQEEDTTLSETEAPGQELAVEAYSTGVASFTVDPNADTSHCFFPNTSSPVSMPPQETTVAAAARGDNNHISVHPSTAAMESSQLQAPPPLAQEFLPVPYLHPKILAPLGGGNITAPVTWMDLQLASDQTAPPPLEELSSASWIYSSHDMVAAGVELYGFAPGLSNGFSGDGYRLSTGVGYLDPSSFPQNSAPSMAGQDEWWRQFSTQGSSGQS